MTRHRPFEAPDAEQPTRGALDAPLVAALKRGDDTAFGELYDRWFDRVHDLAYRIVRDSEAAADVAQDTFMSAWRNIASLEDDHAFGGWLLRIARNGALNRTRQDNRSRPADDDQLAMIERTQTRPEDRLAALDDPARVAEDAELRALLWESAEALGERDREVLDLQLRHGLAPADIADVIGVNRNAANQLAHRVRQRLAGAVESRVLWRGGEPACTRLETELHSAGVDAFGPEAVRIAVKHVAACKGCEERKRTALTPAALFSAIPILGVPALKAKTAHALAASGAPMHGSKALRPHGLRRLRHLRRHARRLLVGGGALSAAAVAIVVTIATTQTGAESPRPSSAPSTTAASVSPTTRQPVVAPTATVALEPTTGPAPTTAPAPTASTTTVMPPPTIEFAVSPASINRSYLVPQEAPILKWNVSELPVGSVHVHGPNFDNIDPNGATGICPLPPTGTTCDAPAGAHVYILNVKNASGEIIETRTATLTINP